MNPIQAAIEKGVERFDEKFGYSYFKDGDIDGRVERNSIEIKQIRFFIRTFATSILKVVVEGMPEEKYVHSRKEREEIQIPLYKDGWNSYRTAMLKPLQEVLKEV